MYPTIPRVNSDILETVRRKYRRAAIVCLLWASAVAVIEFFFMQEYFSTRLNTFNAILIWIVLSLIPFFAMRVPKMLLDKPWRGTVISVEHKREARALTFHRRSVIYHPVTYITIKNESGVEIHRFPDMRLKFNEGDVICHLKGTKYPIFAVQPPDGTQICPICGTKVSAPTHSCPVCEHSVIKGKNIR